MAELEEFSLPEYVYVTNISPVADGNALMNCHICYK